MSGWQRYCVRNRIGAVDFDKRTNMACSKPVVSEVPEVPEVPVVSEVPEVPEEDEEDEADEEDEEETPLPLPVLRTTGGSCIGSPTMTILLH